MTFAGIIGLLIFIYMRPPEFIPSIATIPFLYLFLAVTIVGIIIDVGSRKLRMFAGPQHRLAVLFLFWCVVSIVIRKPSETVAQAITIAVSVTLFMLVSVGIQTVPRFIKSTLVIFALGLFVAVICVLQGLEPYTCIRVIPDTGMTKGDRTSILCPMVGEDGQQIDGQAKCYEDGESGYAYLCEKPGPLGTFSVQGRVRYLGVLQDPNEIALATSIAVPFAFSFLEQKRSFFRLVLLLVTLVIVGIAVVFSQSRGGQLVLASVLGAYFIKKYGVKLGVAIAAAMSGPMMLLGGRSGEDADQSALERLEAAAAGIRMMIQSPLVGVGLNQFLEYHPLLPHNAYINAAAELGFGGVCLFLTLVVISVRIPIAVLQHEFAEDPEIDQVKSLAMAMLAAFVGACIGIFFLTWTYHYVLWIHFGLSGALYSVAKAKDPTFEVKVTKEDAKKAAMIAVGIIVALTIQCKRKGAW